MKRAVVLQHVPTEGPHRLRGHLEGAGLAVEVRRLDRGEPVPSDLPDDDVLVVMGGPMGVGDIGEPTYPFLAAEAALLRQRVAVGAPVLGVCLGAQLLAHAAGASVYPNTRAGEDIGAPPVRVLEVGWAPVTFFDVGREPALEGLAPEEVMLHWHGDTFDLPAGAKLLASTPFCRHQAFRLGQRLYGLQFHCEVDADAVAAFVRTDAEYVARACGPEGAARILADTERAMPRFRAASDRLMANIVRALVY